MQLQNVVVLLDEVEEFCLDRSNAQLGMESRTLTTVLKVPVLERRSPPTPPCHLGPLGSRWLPTLESSHGAAPSGGCGMAVRPGRWRSF